MPTFTITFTDRFSGDVRSIQTTRAAHLVTLWEVAEPGEPLSLWRDERLLAEVVEHAPGVWVVMRS